jgi:hypothetical protein
VVKMRVLNAQPPKNWSKLRYHPGQWAAITSQAKFINLICGRRSGKTDLARRKIVLSLTEKKPWNDPRYFYALPTYRQAKKVAWMEFLKLIPKSWIHTQNVMDLYIKTIFGSELYVVGMDSPQRIEGLGYDGCVVDEACDHKPGSFDLSILPAITDRDGWAWRIGVPKRTGTCSQEVKVAYDRGLDPDFPDIESYSWKSSDILPESIIAERRRVMDERDFREQFEATWEQAGGTIFYTFDKSKNVYEEICQYRPHLPLYIGQDFNVDPMCWVIGQCIQDHPMFPGMKILVIFDELFIHNTNTLDSLKELYNRYGDKHKGQWRFYPDASSTSDKTSAACSDYVHIINFCRTNKLDFVICAPKKNPRLKDRFSVTNAAICNTDGDRRLFVHPKCRRLIMDLEYRSYKEGSMMPLENDKNMGHSSDSLGYLCWGEFPMELEDVTGPSVLIRSF